MIANAEKILRSSEFEHACWGGGYILAGIGQGKIDALSLGSFQGWDREDDNVRFDGLPNPTACNIGEGVPDRTNKNAEGKLFNGSRYAIPARSRYTYMYIQQSRDERKRFASGKVTS